MITTATDFRALGDTDLDSFTAALTRAMPGHNSPLPPEAAAMYRIAQPKGLSRLAVAQAWIERHNETNDADLVYYPRRYHNLFAVRGEGGDFAKYASYAEATAAWVDLILGPVYADIHTVAAFTARYAPWSDGNNPDAYGTSIVGEVNRLPLVETGGSEPPVSTDTGDVYAGVMGTDDYTISFGFAEDGGPDFYGYGAEHGLDGRAHTGVDILCDPATPLYAPFDGMIVCSHTGGEAGAWNQGCAAFPDDMGRGNGRVEILHSDGVRSIILGHTSRNAGLAYGQKVRAGDLVAYSGGMNNAWHVHVEARVWDGEWYWIQDPAQVFGGGYHAPHPYAPRLPVPQNKSLDTFATVRVLADRLPVLQYGNADAPSVSDDLVSGDTFRAALQVLGDDGRWYWISNLDGRVPVVGTTIQE